MSPLAINGDAKTTTKPVIDTIQLENLLLRDEEIFQTSLNSEDYLESLAPIVKDALRANGLSDLIHKLNDIVREKDDELTDLSMSSTQDINSCIDSIDRIHDESSELGKNLQQVSLFLNKSVYELVSRKKELIKCNDVTSKINETSNVLNLCIQVLEITNKIHELIKQNKYFSALKLIDELTNIHLPKVENYSFAVKIYDSVPLLTKTIKDESFDNLCKWVSVNIERKLEAIGDSLFDNIIRLQDNWDAIKKAEGPNSSFTPHKLNSPIEVAIRDPSNSYNIFFDKTLLINSATLYDAMLVYQTLNEDDQLSRMYHKEWIKKYNRVIYPITSSVGADSGSSFAESSADFSDLNSLEEYLKRIAAFFVADKHINIATKFLLRSNDNSNDLWDSYVTKLKPVLLKYLLNHLFNLDDIIDFKDLLGDFIQVMENNEYRILELYDVMMVVFRENFAPEIIKQFRADFIQLIHSDHYMPLVVSDREDYENVMKVCWYHPEVSFAAHKVKKMPVSFPFSEDFVDYCLWIRSLLDDSLAFIGRYYSHEQNEINSIIVNEIFERALGKEKNFGISNDIKDFIDENSHNKEVISQTYVNLEYYLYSLYEIGKLVNQKLRTHTGIGINNIDAKGTFVLRAVDHLTQVRKYSEDAIFNMVDQKIKDLLETVEYNDWLPSRPNDDASYFVKDFALYLENIFTSTFSNLPSSLRTLGLFRSFDYISEYFLNILKDCDRYNMIAIDNFDLDITYLEDLMRQLYSTGAEDDGSGGSVALQSTFEELRQCIDLLKLNNYEDFTKNPSYRMRKYNRIPFEEGMKLIGKMVREEDISSGNDTGSIYTVELHAPSLSSSTASKLAKFSSKFARPEGRER